MENLSERQLREKDYYEQFSKNFNTDVQIDFSPVEGPLLEKDRRPWNSYWRTYEVLVDSYKNKHFNSDPTLLDFGCGPGDNALRFSRIGFKVTGFDVCESNIRNCEELFEKNHQDGNFVVSVAENLSFEDESFDAVAGIDILHHVEIEKAILEVKRVLKKGGIAVFREPVEVPVLDWIRNTALVKAIVPNSPSLDQHITVDERKLNHRDFSVIKKIFPEVKIERSSILSRFDKFFTKKDPSQPSLLEKIDYYLGKCLPFYTNLGGGSVIIVRRSI